MKKLKELRSRAFNASVIALTVSTIITLICYFCGKSLTSMVYNIPFYDFGYNKDIFYTIPILSIWYLVPIFTFFIFQIKYFYLSFKTWEIDEEDSMGLWISIFFGVVGGIVSLFFYETLNRQITTVTSLFVVSIIIPPLFGFKSRLAIFFWIIVLALFGLFSTFVFCLFYTSYGVIESFGIAIIIFIFLSITYIITTGAFWSLVSFIERTILVIKSPVVRATIKGKNHEIGEEIEANVEKAEA